MTEYLEKYRQWMRSLPPGQHSYFQLDRVMGSLVLILMNVAFGFFLFLAGTILWNSPINFLKIAGVVVALYGFHRWLWNEPM